MANPSGNVRLFEVNLISHRVHTFFRRRAFQKWCTVAAFVMLAGGAFMAVQAALHVGNIFKIRTGIHGREENIRQGEAKLASLDERRKQALAEIQEIAPLVPIANARITWTPKFAALAESFPPGMNLVSFRGGQGDLFGSLVAKLPAAQGPAGLAKMNFSVVYYPGAATREYPITFVENFRRRISPDRVALESLEQDSWQARTAVMLRGSAEGARSH